MTGVRDPSEIARFSEEVDVLVVGLGAAGAAAALEASRTGAETLVLERAGGGGGTSAMSGGVLYLGGGTALQKECGFEDSAEEMFRYLMASCGESPDEEKMRLYCEGSVAHYDWVVGEGVPFKPIFYHGCSGEPPTDDGLVWSGSERAYPFCDVAVPAPRGHVPRVEHQAGPLLMQKLCAAVEASPARIAANHRCTALVQEPDGHVVGAVCESFGEERCIRVRRGVILTTGGFINNRGATTGPASASASRPARTPCTWTPPPSRCPPRSPGASSAVCSSTATVSASSTKTPTTDAWASGPSSVTRDAPG
jgi:3-oxo-5alpha-steroid 4-dehydrogenase